MKGYLNIHTHISKHPDTEIISLSPNMLLENQVAIHASVGIHPWELMETHADSLWKALQKTVEDKRVVAIGECGIDKLKGPSLDLQMALFKKEALLAESRSIPLVIHCVKAFNELILLKKEIKPLQPWIIHGFRGKLSLPTDCIRHGFYLSIGAYFQEDALKAIPTDKLFIETDESDKPIEDIYQNIAQVRGMELEELRECINKNAREVFFKS
jgi:TatD DNase family protein